MKKLIVIVLVFLTLTSCKNSGKSGDTNRVKVTDIKLLPPPQQPPNADVNIGAADQKADPGAAPNNDVSTKIIKEGSIEFETGDLAGTRKQILSCLKRSGGYVEQDNQSTNSDDNNRDYELKIRIPTKYFDTFLDTVSTVADKIESKNISVTDVTAHYIDVKTRLDNKKILEKRYLNLLSKSSKIADLLDIENKLTEIRSDIESTQGQLNYLDKQVAYSSLDITYHTKQTAPANTEDGFGAKFKTALTNGWHSLQDLFFGFISLWPMLITFLIVVGLIIRWQKRRRAKNVN